MNNEILNLAYASEKSAQNLYENVCEFDEVFVQISAIRERAIELIKTYAKNNDFELDEPAKSVFFAPDNTYDALISAINYENQLNKMYENFTQNLDDEQLKDVLFRLWATSHNEYLPALKAKLSLNLNPNLQTNQSEILNSFTGGEDLLSNYQKSFNEMSESLQNVISGKADKAELAKILNNPNFSFFSGLALGALGVATLGKTINKENKSE